MYIQLRNKRLQFNANNLDFLKIDFPNTLVEP